MKYLAAFAFALTGCASGKHDVQVVGVQGGDIDLATADVVVSSITLTPCDDSENVEITLNSAVDLLGPPQPHAVKDQDWCRVELACEDTPEAGGLSLAGTLGSAELMGSLACDGPALEGKFEALNGDLVLVFDLGLLLSDVESDGVSVSFPYGSPQSESLTRDLPEALYFGTPDSAATKFGEDWPFSEDSFDSRGE